jgi:hypothetical protein
MMISLLIGCGAESKSACSVQICCELTTRSAKVVDDLMYVGYSNRVYVVLLRLIVSCCEDASMLLACNIESTSEGKREFRPKWSAIYTHQGRQSW